MNTFFIAQVAGIIGWILLIYSYYKEDIDNLLYIQILSSIFYCVNYLLLDAGSGFYICLFELVKTVGYYKTDKDDLIFLVSLPIYGLIAYFTFDHWYAILPIIGSIIDALTLSKSRNVAVAGGIASNFIWVIYDLLILSISGAITDALVALSNLSILVLGYSRLIKSTDLHFVSGHYISKNVLERIRKIDKQNYGEDYTWNIDYQEVIYSLNKDSFIFIKNNQGIVGYINYLSITEDCLNRIKESDELINEYNLNEIKNYTKKNKNYVLIESINIEHRYQNYKVSNKITNNIKKIIKKKTLDNCTIDTILATAVTEFEKNTLENAHFIEYKKYSEKESLYILTKEDIKKYYINERVIEQSKYNVVVNEEVKDILLYNIVELDKKHFDSKYLWTYEYQKELFNKNKKSMITVLSNGNLVGYINYLCVTKDKYEETVLSNKIVDEYSLDDIVKYKKNTKNYVILNSIVIEEAYQDGYTIELLTKRLKRELRKLHNDGYKIAGIATTTVSKDGSKFAEEFGFTLQKKLEDNTKLYVIEGNELKEFLS